MKPTVRNCVLPPFRAPKGNSENVKHDHNVNKVFLFCTYIVTSNTYACSLYMGIYNEGDYEIIELK